MLPLEHGTVVRLALKTISKVIVSLNGWTGRLSVLLLYLAYQFARTYLFKYGIIGLDEYRFAAQVAICLTSAFPVAGNKESLYNTVVQALFSVFLIVIAFVLYTDCEAEFCCLVNSLAPGGCGTTTALEKEAKAHLEKRRARDVALGLPTRSSPKDQMKFRQRRYPSAISQAIIMRRLRKTIPPKSGKRGSNVVLEALDDFVCSTKDTNNNFEGISRTFIALNSPEKRRQQRELYRQQTLTKSPVVAKERQTEIKDAPPEPKRIPMMTTSTLLQKPENDLVDMGRPVEEAMPDDLVQRGDYLDIEGEKPARQLPKRSRQDRVLEAVKPLDPEEVQNDDQQFQFLEQHKYIYFPLTTEKPPPEVIEPKFVGWGLKTITTKAEKVIAERTALITNCGPGKCGEAVPKPLSDVLQKSDDQGDRKI